MVRSQGFSSQFLNNAKSKSEQLSSVGECHERGGQSCDLSGACTLKQHDSCTQESLSCFYPPDQRKAL